MNGSELIKIATPFKTQCRDKQSIKEKEILYDGSKDADHKIIEYYSIDFFHSVIQWTSINSGNDAFYTEELINLPFMIQTR